MQTVLLVLQFVLALALIVTVLLQRSEGGGLGIGGGGGGGGGMGGLMTSRGTASLLTRATAILAAAFMLNSLVLAILAGDVRPTGSILEPQAPLSGTLEEQGVIGTAPTPDADGPNPAEPAEPDVPLAE